MQFNAFSPEKKEGGLFSASFVTYLISLPILNKKVRRRYSDFDWLRELLIDIYPGIFVRELVYIDTTTTE
jgi:hypothetical protein